MTIARRRLVPVLLAALLVGLLPSTAWAASPIAGDDPSEACITDITGGSFPIPEDWGQFVFPPGPGYRCWIGDNDSDPDGDPLTWSLVTPPAHGDLFLDGPTGLTAYTPDPEYSTLAGDRPGGTWVSDSFVYEVSDGADTDTATFRFWIAPFNDPPTFNPGGDVTVDEDSGPFSAAWATAVTPGPAPSEAHQTVTFQILVGQSDLFAVPPAIASDGTLTFTPAQDQYGLSQVTVLAHDDGGLESYSGVNPPDPPDDTSDPVTFQIVVDPVNDPPVAVDDPGTQCGDTSSTGGSFLLPEDNGPLYHLPPCYPLANDTDAEGDDLTYEVLTPPSHGVLEQGGNQYLRYEPDADHGTRPGNVPGGTWVSDSFTYRAFDGQAWSQPATMRYWIAEINDAPSFSAGTDVNVLEDSGPYAAAWATAIETGPPAESWQTVSFETTNVSVVGGGTLFAVVPTIGADGTLTFTPAPDAVGIANVTVEARDDGGLEDYGIGTPAQNPDDTTDPVTFQIAVGGVNDAPVAADDSATLSDGPAVAIPVLANDTDADGDPLQITGATGATKGVVAITGGGIGLTYDPHAGALGIDTFTYTVADGHGGTDSASVTVTLGDTTPPTITAITEGLPGQTVGTSTVRTRIKWAGQDEGSGINNYHLQVSVNGGAFGTIALSNPTATWVDRTLTTGATYRFRVRAKDRQGNVSAFTTWPTLTPTRLQEATSLATYTGTWSTALHRSALNGKTRYASSSSRKVVVRFIGRDVGWVATRTTGSGRADVRIDGAPVGTVQLDRSATAFRQLVLGRHLATSGWHTIEIRPRGDGRVNLDALVILR